MTAAAKPAQSTGFMARVRAWISDPNPILVKELRATFRTNLFIRFLYLATGLVGLIVLVTGAAIASGEMAPATVGQIVFQLFFGATLFVLCLIAPGYASAAITAEHEQETWESLVLSGMSPWRIVIGKFLACYAAIALVLVAFSPVVGVAFLFGGVSPGQVLFGFLSMLVALAPAVAFGVALSARLRSTRLSIVLATFLYVPIAIAATSLLGALGESARSAWSLGTEGPFFYTEALANRLDQPDTWGLLVALPAYAFGMPVWFLLASAVAGVQPPGEDRSTALKIWALALFVGSLAMGAMGVALMPSGNDAAGAAGMATAVASFAAISLGVLFANEPPLPPRPLEAKRASLPIWKKAMLAVGPGAAGTLRFVMLLSVVMPIGVALLAIALHAALHPRWPATDRTGFDLALIALSVGAAAVSCFVAAFASWLRLVLRNGVAARVLALAVLATATVLPFLVGVIGDPEAFDNLDRWAPFPVHFAPIYPAILAVQLANTSSGLGQIARITVTLGVWGSAAILFWVLVELRVRAARKQLIAKRAEQEANAGRPSGEIGKTVVRLAQQPEPASTEAKPEEPEAKPEAKPEESA